MRDRFRWIIQRLAMPWFNEAREAERNHASDQLFASSRATRGAATRKIRQGSLRDGYRAYGERVKR